MKPGSAIAGLRLGAWRLGFPALPASLPAQPVKLTPDRHAQPNVPKGKLIAMPKWTSKVFAGSERDWWIYVPAQYTADKPAAVMVFQDGKNDLDNDHGNWPIANERMASALNYQGYDHKFVYTEGGHNSNEACPLLPDALRWLWRDWN